MARCRLADHVLDASLDRMRLSIPYVLQAELLEHRVFSQLCTLLERGQGPDLLLPTLSALANLATDMDRCECCSLSWADWRLLLPWHVLWELVGGPDARLQVGTHVELGRPQT